MRRLTIDDLPDPLHQICTYEKATLFLIRDYNRVIKQLRVTIQTLAIEPQVITLHLSYYQPQRVRDFYFCDHSQRVSACLCNLRLSDPVEIKLDNQDIETQLRKVLPDFQPKKKQPIIAMVEVMVAKGNDEPPKNLGYLPFNLLLDATKPNPNFTLQSRPYVDSVYQAGSKIVAHLDWLNDLEYDAQRLKQQIAKAQSLITNPPEPEPPGIIDVPNHAK